MLTTIIHQFILLTQQGDDLAVRRPIDKVDYTHSTSTGNCKQMSWSGYVAK